MAGSSAMTPTCDHCGLADPEGNLICRVCGQCQKHDECAYYGPDPGIEVVLTEHPENAPICWGVHVRVLRPYDDTTLGPGQIGFWGEVLSDDAPWAVGHHILIIQYERLHGMVWEAVNLPTPPKFSTTAEAVQWLESVASTLP